MPKINREKESSIKHISKQSMNQDSHFQHSCSQRNTKSSRKKQGTRTVREEKSKNHNAVKSHNKQNSQILNALKSYMSCSDLRMQQPHEPIHLPISSPSQRNQWNLMKTQVINRKQNQTPSLDCLSTPKVFLQQPPHEICLQRIDLDPKSKEFCMFIEHQINKMNEQISKIQTAYEKNLNVTHIVPPLNSLLLLVNFILGKMSYKGQQILLQCQQVQIANQEYRGEVIRIQKQTEKWEKKMERMNKVQEELRGELARLRSVMESYQMENLQVKKQNHILNQVIAQMNIQVEKGEIKVSKIQAQFLALQQQLERSSNYIKQLQQQIMECEDAVNKAEHLQQQLKIMQLQKQKWRYRCHEEMVQGQQ